MTTPPVPDREGSTGDLPFLPPPPTGPIAAPSGPDPESIEDEPTTSVAIQTDAPDVGASVDSQRRRKPVPAYGDLPAGDEANVEALR